jgi:hypothetical protein
MTDKEAMAMALEALEAMQMYAEAERKGLRICDEAITALKERLADPMREVQRLGQEIEQEKALQALHNENKRLGLYRDVYAEPESECDPCKPDIFVMTYEPVEEAAPAQPAQRTEIIAAAIRARGQA